MSEMAAGKFKAECLAVMDEVQAKREPVPIAKRGKPVVKLVPDDEPKKSLFGCMKGEIVMTSGVRVVGFFTIRRPPQASPTMGERAKFGTGLVNELAST